MGNSSSGMNFDLGLDCILLLACSDDSHMLPRTLNRIRGPTVLQREAGQATEQKCRRGLVSRAETEHVGEKCLRLIKPIL